MKSSRSRRAERIGSRVRPASRPAGSPLQRRQADTEGQVGYGPPYGLQHQVQEQGRPPELIGTMVGRRRQELMDQIAVDGQYVHAHLPDASLTVQPRVRGLGEL